MLTERDKEIHAEGLVTIDRLEALQHALRADAREARQRSKEPGMDERFAASFRGKASAYDHAATMVETLIRGNAMHPPRWSEARRLAREWGKRRAQRRQTRENVGDRNG